MRSSFQWFVSSLAVVVFKGVSVVQPLTVSTNSLSSWLRWFKLHSTNLRHLLHFQSKQYGGTSNPPMSPAARKSPVSHLISFNLAVEASQYKLEDSGSRFRYTEVKQ